MHYQLLLINFSLLSCQLPSRKTNVKKEKPKQSAKKLKSQKAKKLKCQTAKIQSTKNPYLASHVHDQEFCTSFYPDRYWFDAISSAMALCQYDAYWCAYG